MADDKVSVQSQSSSGLTAEQQQAADEITKKMQEMNGATTTEVKSETLVPKTENAVIAESKPEVTAEEPKAEQPVAQATPEITSTPAVTETKPTETKPAEPVASATPVAPIVPVAPVAPVVPEAASTKAPEETPVKADEAAKPKTDPSTEEKIEETHQEAMELVNEIKEVAEDLKEINEEPVVETAPIVPAQTVTPPSQPVTPDVSTVTPAVAPTPVATATPSPVTAPAPAATTIQPIVSNSSKLGFIPKILSMFKFNFNLSKFLKFKKSDQNAPSDTTKSKVKIPKPVFFALIGLGIVVLLLVILGGSVYFMVKPVIANGQTTSNLAKETYQLLKAQDLVSAETKLKETRDSLLKTQKSYQSLSWLKFVPFVSKYQKDGEAALNAGVAGVEAAEITISAITPYADILGFKGKGSFEGGTAEDRVARMVETLDKVTPKMEEIAGKLTIVKSEISKIDPADYPEKAQGKDVRAKLVEVKQLVDEATLAVTDARPIIEVLPAILGYPEGKKYLVIFQNDGELRPTGGFMSAFAVLQLDKGRVKPEKSDDIYSLDNKFGRNVEAPEIIQKYLNEKVWHLRNMNLSPDYKESMTTFKQYYEGLRDEPKVDGIISIDTETLKRIVEVVGPLNVPEFGTFTVEMDKRCNLAQIVCELEYIVDKPLATVASNRKSNILGPMMQTLMQKSLGGGKEQLSKLVPLLFKLLEEKHVLVYFGDDKYEKAAESFNIAGRITDYEGDYLHVNNANFGGAKSNFYIEDSVDQEIEIAADGTVQKKVTLTYDHKEPMDNCNLEAGGLCLSGIQRNYFRVYVPKGSQLVEGLGSEVEIKSHEEFGKTYFDGKFDLRPMSRAKVQLVYKLPFKVQKGQDYKMLIQKQPGTKNDKYTITINGKEDTFDLNKDTEKIWKI